jgi:hypothetical protein
VLLSMPLYATSTGPSSGDDPSCYEPERLYRLVRYPIDIALPASSVRSQPSAMRPAATPRRRSCEKQRSQSPKAQPHDDIAVGLGAEWDVVGGRAAGGDADGPTACFWMNLARQLLAASPAHPRRWPMAARSSRVVLVANATLVVGNANVFGGRHDRLDDAVCTACGVGWSTRDELLHPLDRALPVLEQAEVADLNVSNHAGSSRFL